MAMATPMPPTSNVSAIDETAVVDAADAKPEPVPQSGVGGEAAPALEEVLPLDEEQGVSVLANSETHCILALPVVSTPTGLQPRDTPAEDSSTEAPGRTASDEPSEDFAPRELSASAPVFVPAASKGLSLAATVFVPGGDKATDPRVHLAHSIMSKAAGITIDGSCSSQNFRLRGQANVVKEVDEDDILAQLPWSHRQMLRYSFTDEDSGHEAPYFVGALKSFSNSKGFGFLTCSQAKEHWGRDVFIHKSQVPVPWQLGMPVEFSIYTNANGCPQAHDCSWLPLLPRRPNQVVPTPPVPVVTAVRPSMPPAAAAALAAAAAPAKMSAAPPMLPAVAAPRILMLPPKPPEPAKRLPLSALLPPEPLATPLPPGRVRSEAPAPRVNEKEPRYLGTVKSYSTEKHYGFMTCDDCPVAPGSIRRDVYFGKSREDQMEECTPVAGQRVEFSLAFKDSKPQARDILWFPIPVISMPKGHHVLPVWLHESGARAYQDSTMEKIKKLLRLMNSGDIETAIVTAIDHQGGCKGPTDSSYEADIDYVTFVLDRAGSSVLAIKNFVRMLLLLMVSKMIRKEVHSTRTEKFATWLLLLAESIDSQDPEVRGHIENVIVQVTNSMEVNGSIREGQRILDALGHLQRKS